MTRHLRHSSDCRIVCVYWLILVAFVGCGVSARATADDAVVLEKSLLPQQPSFSRDIQPIFARSCTGCHGGVKQAGDVSFVRPDSFLPPDGWVIEPGNPEESILFERVTSQDPEMRMPPPDDHAQALKPDEIELIRRWIHQGARWEEHWSRKPVVGPPVARDVASDAWAKQPLDYFVFEALRDAGQSPAGSAEPEQWLRRVTFDLIGLPPTHQELTQFKQAVAAAQPGQVDELFAAEVERLLDSLHFGERWATLWMDLARYADSKGFEKDPHRDVWPYRDWLINAFNTDMPYDEFTIKQLAGDLLPDAEYDDLVATAFHRNTQTNTEGGTDDEEYRVAAVIDRLNTTWTVWQGTTFGCVQCHSHPYEPFENREFYAGLAIFNTTEDVDLDSEFPTLPYVEDEADRNAFVELWRQMEQMQLRLDQIGRRVVAEADWSLLPIETMESSSGVLAEVDGQIRVVDGTVAVGSDYRLKAKVAEFSAIRFKILPESDNPADWPEQGAVLSHLQARIVGDGPSVREIEFALCIPDFRTGTYQCEDSLQKGKAGFGGFPKLNRPRWAVFTTETPIGLAEDERLEFVVNQSASVTGGLSNHLRRFQIEYSVEPAFGVFGQDEEYVAAKKELAELRERISKFQGVALPVMRQQPAESQRETRQFLRGNWLEKGDTVEPDLPAVFKSDESGSEAADRLQFARWLVSQKNPLAGRVWVNRIWAELFGVGIVETAEDFGASGQPPSNISLLNHLAHTMQNDSQWSLKRLLKSIVLSATYRQDSRATSIQMERDPRNRLLARGPRTRLSAEMIRDQALVASGRLNRHIGGPSVMPPQPDGVWQQAYSSAKWKVSQGADRYRRGVYTYWRRTSPYPSFIMFDSPVRDVCSPRRIATNTPLQALVTLNSEVFTELARELSKSVQHDGAETVERAIREMYFRVTSREISSHALAELVQLASDLKASRKLEPAVERPPSPDRKDWGEKRLDPLGVVALAILNSDWALTK